MNENLPRDLADRSAVLEALEKGELAIAQTLYQDAFNALSLPVKTVRKPTYPDAYTRNV